MRRESFDTPLHALKIHAQASGSIRARSITVQVAKEFDSCYVWEDQNSSMLQQVSTYTAPIFFSAMTMDTIEASCY
ncbi:hypothetical protein HETIRDRAFT_310142 [Heterobasidion irregulare TC 32-1]|uniref:Uncharacterized protein n=1 Tax=Heterobasidion irregulare (strain TC 32-1) TaxID=747525 RepID=W4KHK7_HETIT|nr:uncharacterized protein HETIRDRAFT_310142 [Heterobasidion irregulare TC 32-1]ETW85204.1 hypothetical protein HETIRDRAFT_310142 [Heterobasidion irregulare TC 32-1]